MKAMKLSQQQISAYEAIREWLSDGTRKRFVLSGYAGTGKSTLARYISDNIGGVIFCAFTGKAANVLREKGVQEPMTIHKLIYKPKGSPTPDIAHLEFDLAEAKAALDIEKVAQIEMEIARKIKAAGQPSFTLNPESPAVSARLVIVDEYSMLSDKLIEDLERLSKKVLYLGDDFQLPPVAGECPLKPDFRLTEVHRQALDSPILRAATMVREGSAIGLVDWGDFKSCKEIDAQCYLDADQIIVGRNETRRQWNSRMRERLGFSGVMPEVGERLICLKNNHALGLYNGMIDVCHGMIDGGDDEAFFNFGELSHIPAWKGDLLGNSKIYDWKKHGELNRFDFGYVVTCHKSQGSEWDSVIVKYEPVGKGIEARKWLYTALTRARKKVILVA